MGKLIRLNHSAKARTARASRMERPTRADAEDAVRLLIRWAGDDPDREGLIGTPGARGARLSRMVFRI